MIAALLVCAPLAHAQGASYTAGPFNTSGLFYVCPVPSGGTPCPSPSSLFTNVGLSTPLANPIPISQGQTVSFFIAAGQYTVQMPAAGYSQVVTIGGGAASGTPGGALAGVFNISTSCGFAANCLQWVDDNSTDNCGAALTAFLALVNAYAGPGEPQVFVGGSGNGGKAYKLATASCHLEFDIPTTLHLSATLNCAQPSGDNCIQVGPTGLVSYTNAQIFKYQIDGGGSITGCANLTTGCIHVEPNTVNSLITELNFVNAGATNATLGSCTNYSVFYDSPIAEGTLSYTHWQVTDTGTGRCAYSNASGSLTGSNTMSFIGNTIGGQNATNTSGCSSQGIIDGGSLGVSQGNNIYAFGIPIRVQGIGHRIVENQIDNAGCAANAVQAAIQFGAASSSTAIGPVTISNNIAQVSGNATHSNPFFQKAGDSTATILGVSIIGNINNGANGTNFGNLVASPQNCSINTTFTTMCYEYGNVAMGGLVTCGTANVGWQFENIFAACTTSGQVANLGNTALYTPPGTKSQMISCQVLLTTAATTSSTLPQCVVSFTDVFTNATQSITLTPVWASGTVGCSGTTTNTLGNSCEGQALVIPKAGVVVNYSTTGYASVGGTAMAYQVFVRSTAQ